MGRLKYISGASGETFELDGELSFAQTALGIRGSESDYELGFRDIESESMPARKATLDVTFLDLDEADRLVSIKDADRALKAPGTIVADGWEQRAYLGNFIPNELTTFTLKASVGCDLLDGCWRKGRLLHMFPNSGDMEGTKRYPYKYPYRYASEYGARSVTVNTKKPIAFLMCIFGFVRNPSIRIANNTYKANVTVPKGGYLLIDARDSSATLVAADGLRTDVYNSCVRGQGEGSGEYAWEKIPAGTSFARWDDTFGFDLTLFEESSAPPFGSGL